MRADGNIQLRARRLRKAMSLPEVLLWRNLRGRAEGRPIFRRQHALGPYVLDFYCPAARLCVEIDGGSHGFGDRPARDARRDAYLRGLGVRTIRISARGVLEAPYDIAQSLIEAAARTSPARGGGGPRSGGGGGGSS